MAKKNLRRTWKILETKPCSRNFIKRDYHLGSPSCTKLGIFLKKVKRRTQTNKPKDKTIDCYALGLPSDRFICLFIWVFGYLMPNPFLYK